MYKSNWRIYLNNTFAFIIYLVLGIYFRKRTLNSNNLLFINTGQIGDLLISSLIFSNQDLLTKDKTVYFIVRDRYKELYTDYHGPIKIISWNYNNYKFNPFYRIVFLLKLHNIGFNTCVNLTAARGITNDEISLLSSAKKIYCLNNNWKYLTKLFGEKMDSYYDEIKSYNTMNELLRHKNIIQELAESDINPKTTIHISDKRKFEIMKSLYHKAPSLNNKSYIAIAPISDGELRNWPIRNYIQLCELILTHTKHYIVLIGTKLQYSSLSRIQNVNPDRIINIAGEYSVLDSAAIVGHSLCFIGNDSGFTHVAKALGKQIFAIVGGGCYDMFFPYPGLNHDAIFYHQLDCFGCEWRCNQLQPYCVVNVSVDEVYTKLLKFMDDIY